MLDAFPALFPTSHVYVPSSLISTLVITKVLLSDDSLARGGIAELSFNQPTVGTGSPTTGQVKLSVSPTRSDWFRSKRVILDATGYGNKEEISE